MRPIIFPLPGHEELANSLAKILGWEVAVNTYLKFPDGETYLRSELSLRDRQVVLLCSFSPPDERLMALYLSIQLCRDSGAKQVGLVAPYLAYMRQDKAFKPGEAVSARYFLQLLSGWVDFLVTVDPHLHRIASLGEFLRIPHRIVHAAPALAGWIATHVQTPVVIGPDEESRQWVAEVAAACAAPHTVFKKTRLGDRKVQMEGEGLEAFSGCQPVIVDDILSTGTTLLEAAKIVKKAGLPPPISLSIHGLFSTQAYDQLRRSGIPRIVTTNTVSNPAHDIDITDLIAAQIKALI